MDRIPSLLLALGAALLAPITSDAQSISTGLAGSDRGISAYEILTPGPGNFRMPDPAKLEVLPGWRTSAEGRAVHVAGLSFKLAEGWKTYWRVPGDYGLPLSIDWSGSKNLLNAELIWPKPTVFDEGEYDLIGYAGELVLPVVLWPADESLPIHMESVLNFGVCKDICIPVSASLSATLTPEQIWLDEAIQLALREVPDVVHSDQGDQAAACRIQPSPSGYRIEAKLALPRMGQDKEIVVFEVPGQPFWFGQADTLRTGSRQLVATAEMKIMGGVPAAVDRSQFVITVLGDGRAVEFRGC